MSEEFEKSPIEVAKSNLKAARHYRDTQSRALTTAQTRLIATEHEHDKANKLVQKWSDAVEAMERADRHAAS